MQKITPHLWFDREAREAAAFYSSVFRANGGSASGGKASRIKSVATLEGTPSGAVDVVAAELLGQEFTLMSAGAYFKFTPAVSFLIACATSQEVDALWRRLAEGGATLMELGEYPFSERYGWVQDRFGLSWQVMSTGGREPGESITPTLMYVGEQCGRAEEAIHFYASVFRSARVGDVLRYGRGEDPDKEGTIKHAEFELEGQGFAAMDSARAHGFGFNEAVSFVVRCDTQEEIDHYWGLLSAEPQAEQCGWLKDKYGLSWQIVPTILEGMTTDKDKARVARVTEAFLQMKKFDIAALKRAYEGPCCP